ncbi:MAG TPA: sarcosine oxidase subunit alpha family protein [Xanthobacteraceae bacterium]|jgi:sarcosine oxidase subunit alpha
MDDLTYRLPVGGRIDRTRPLEFRFNGKRYCGFRGDTLASALLANGVHFVARSFKYHRPRGILSAGSEEPNALVQLENGAFSTPNVRATQIELYEGLEASSVNAWPSLESDLGAINALFGRMLVAGFYYKTFMWPKSFWARFYEPVIRRVAGLGKPPAAPDPDIYERMFAHCDVLVVGAGPAGLAAALAAGQTGARVFLVDEQNEPGGSLLARREIIGGIPGMDWVGRTVAELSAMPEMTLLSRTVAFGYYDHNYVMLIERRTDHLGPGRCSGRARERLWHLRAKSVVLATGAHERPLVFAGNDRPGIMLAAAVEAYVNRYAVVPGRRAVVFSNNDSAYRAALTLADAGAEIAAVIDVRDGANGIWPARARQRGIRVLDAHAIVATRGRRRLTSVGIARLDSSGHGFGPINWAECDLLAMSGGFSPAVHLFSQSQGKLKFDEKIAAFVPSTSVQRQRIVGAASGTFALRESLAEGSLAGAGAAAECGFGTGTAPSAPAVDGIEVSPVRAFWLVGSATGMRDGGHRHFVDFQNDVTAADIHIAAREGLASIEHVKRYTTAGMGTDQGKTGNVNALALLSERIGRAITETGTTTFRPPYTPVTFGALAGRDRGELVEPVRTTAIHAWHVSQGAVFEDVGQWRRPRYYPRAGEDMEAAVRRECLAVRGAAGIMDASTLGKIDIQGADSAAFLDRIYTNHWTTLKVGQCRYGMMCRDDGMVLDDGVTTRLAPDRFLMTTTTGGAARVLDWLEEWLQTEWPDLKVYCTSVTEQWATIAIAGPRSRTILARLAPDLPLDNEQFPFMTMREAVVAGIAGRVFRISFSGELSFEINIPSRYGRPVWEAAMETSGDYGLTPYGTEAMHVLRAEKGFIIVGQETDGSVTPLDLGMEWMISKRKEFIGRRSLRRPEMSRVDRKQLVGLLPENRDVVLPEGAQLVAGAPRRHDRILTRPIVSPPAPDPTSIGHVTSSYFSPTLERSFALALVKNGRKRFGSTVFAVSRSGGTAARVCEPMLYDELGSRRNG